MKRGSKNNKRVLHIKNSFDFFQQFVGQLEEAELNRVMQYHLDSEGKHKKISFVFLENLEKKHTGSEYVIKLTDKLFRSNDLTDAEKGQIFSIRGQYYYNTNESTKARQSFEWAEKFYIKVNNTDDTNKMLIRQFHLSMDKESIDTSVLAEKLEVLKGEIKDVVMQLMLYTSLGKYYLTRGNFPKAIEYLNKGLEIRENDSTLNLYIGQAYFYNNNLLLAEERLTRVVTDADSSMDSKFHALYQRARIKAGLQKFEESNQDINSISSDDRNNISELKKNNLRHLKNYTELVSQIDKEVLVNIDTIKNEDQVNKNDIKNLKTVHEAIKKTIILLQSRTNNENLSGEMEPLLQKVSLHFNKLSAKTIKIAGFDGLKTYLINKKAFNEEITCLRRLEDVLRIEDEEKNGFLNAISSSQGFTVLEQKIKSMINMVVQEVKYRVYFTDEEVAEYQSPLSAGSTLDTINFVDIINYYSDILHIQKVLCLVESPILKNAGVQDFNQKENRYAFANIITLIGEHTTQLSFKTQAAPKNLIKSIIDYRDIFIKNVSIVQEVRKAQCVYYKEKFCSELGNIKALFENLLLILQTNNLDIMLGYKAINKIISLKSSDENKLTLAVKMQESNSAFKKVVKKLAEMDQTPAIYRNKQFINEEKLAQSTKQAKEQILSDNEYPFSKDTTESHWSLHWVEEYKFLMSMLQDKSNVSNNIEAIRAMINFLNVSMHDENSNSLLFENNSHSDYSKSYVAYNSALLRGLDNQIKHELYALFQSHDITLNTLELIHCNAKLVYSELLKHLCTERKLLDYLKEKIITGMDSETVHNVFEKFLIILKHKFANSYTKIISEFSTISDIVFKSENKLVFNQRDILSQLKEIVLDAYIICLYQGSANMDDTMLESFVLNVMESIKQSATSDKDSMTLSITLIRYYLYQYNVSDSLEESKEVIALINEIINSSVILQISIENEAKSYFTLHTIMAEFYIGNNDFNAAREYLDNIQKGLDKSCDKGMTLEYKIKLKILYAIQALEETPTYDCADYYIKELNRTIGELQNNKFTLNSLERNELLIENIQKLIVKAENIMNSEEESSIEGGKTIFLVIISEDKIGGSVKNHIDIVAEEDEDTMPPLANLDSDGNWTSVDVVGEQKAYSVGPGLDQLD